METLLTKGLAEQAPVYYSPYTSHFVPYQPLTSTGRPSRFDFPALQLTRGLVS
jgi:hypothetical protein